MQNYRPPPPPPPPNPNPNPINNADITPARIQAIKDYQQQLKGQFPQERDQFRNRKLAILINYHFGEDIDWQQAGTRLGVNFHNDGDDIYRVGVALILFYSNLQRGRMTCIVSSQDWPLCECCRRHRNMNFIYLSRNRTIPNRVFEMGSICVNLMVAVIRGISYAQASAIIKSQELQLINQVAIQQRYQQIIEYLDMALQSRQMNQEQEQMSDTHKQWLDLLKQLRQFYYEHRNDNQFQWYRQLNLDQLVMFNNIMNYFQQRFMVDRRLFRFSLRDHNERNRRYFSERQLGQLQQFLHGRTIIHIQIPPGQRRIDQIGFLINLLPRSEPEPQSQPEQQSQPPVQEQQQQNRMVNNNADYKQSSTQQDDFDNFDQNENRSSSKNKKPISKVDKSRDKRSGFNSSREGSKEKQVTLKQFYQRRSQQKQRRKQMKQKQEEQERRKKKQQLNIISQMQSERSSQPPQNHGREQNLPNYQPGLNMGISRIASDPIQDRNMQSNNTQPAQQMPVPIFSTYNQLSSNSQINTNNNGRLLTNATPYASQNTRKKEPETADKKDKEEPENRNEENKKK